MESRTLEFLPLESAVMEKMVAGTHPVLVALRAQYEHSSAGRRHMTGVGFWLDLEVSRDTPSVPRFKRLWFTDVVAELEGLEHGAGFALLVEDGRINFLEGFTYDEPWPDRPGAFTVRYLHGDERAPTIEEIDQALGKSDPDRPTAR